MLIPFWSFMLLAGPEIASLVIIASVPKWCVVNKYEVAVPICFTRKTG